MSGSVNKVILVGNLGADPELRTTSTGSDVANIRIATSRAYTSKAGERVEATEWHSVVLWGKLAELAGRYLSKGRKVYIEGRLQTRDWVDETTGATRYRTEIVAHEMTFLGSSVHNPEEVAQERTRGANPSKTPRATRKRREDPPTGAVGPKTNPYNDDDLPF